MASIKIENLHKRYGVFHALKGVSLEIREGEFFSLLGPSGSGKTTLLRLLAGFEEASLGRIRFGQKEVTYLSPEKRETGMVFQNYALFPHLNVSENIAYGLKARRVPKPEAAARVEEMLALANLTGFGVRDVHSLSGGQQQRVALARAIAPHPGVLLMDEPLSNLDAKLRISTRAQLRSLQKELGMTTVYVTHDQAEAFALSDRLAVLLDGEIQQTGTPIEVYNFPANRHVADFLGDMNWIHGIALENTGEALRATFPGGEVEIPGKQPIKAGDKLLLGARPEAFQPSDGVGFLLRGVIQECQYEGPQWRLFARCHETEVQLLWPSPRVSVAPKVGQEISFSINPASLMVFADT